MTNPNSSPSGNNSANQNPWTDMASGAKSETQSTHEARTREQYHQSGEKANESAIRENENDALLARRAEILRQLAALDGDEPTVSQPEPQPAHIDTPSQAPVIPNQTPNQVPNPNQAPTPAEIAAAKDKAKKSKGFRNFLERNILTIAIAATLALGAVTGVVALNRDRQQLPSEETPVVTTTESTPDAGDRDKQHEALTGIEQLDELIDGSLAQYDNVGCANSEGKINQTALANPRAVAEYLGWDADNLTPEQRGKIHEYLAYSQDFTAAADARIFNLNGFRELSQSEAEDRIRGMSPDEKWDLIHQLQGMYGNTEYAYATAGGDSFNVQRLTGDGHSDFKERILNQNTKMLRGTTTLEDGTKIIYEEKNDCGNNGDRIRIERPGQPTPTVIEIGDPDTPVIPITPQNITTPGNSEDPTPDPETDPLKPSVVVDDTDPTPPTPNPDPTPGPGPGPAPDPDPTPDPDTSKRIENLIRIDENIKKDIAEDIHTGKVEVHQDDATEDTKTEKPDGKVYDGTTPNLVQNEASKSATPVKPAGESEGKGEAPKISPENDYSEDHGGANEENVAENPVQANTEAQQAANRAAETQQAASLEQAINNFNFN